MPDENDSRGFDRAVALIGAGAGVKAAAVVVTSGLSLATTILLVRMLGASLYGALALGLSIVGLSAALTKAGFGVAATRTIAASLAVDDRESAIDTTRGVTTFVLLGGVVGSALVLSSLVATQSQLSLSVRVTVGVGLAFLLVGRDAAAASGAVARGFGRVRLMELPALAQVISKFGIVVVLLALGATSLSAAAAGLGVSGLVAALVAAFVVTAMPRPRSARGLRPSFTSFTSLLRLGIPYAMAGVAAKLIASFDVFILGVSHPGAPVGAYAPVLSLIEASVMLAPIMLTTLFIAAATRLYAQGEQSAFSRLYVTVSKVSILLAMPAFALFAVSPTVVIRFVFGSDFPVDETVVRVLLLGLFLNVAFGVNMQALIASGARWRLARALVLPAGTMVAISLALIPGFGAIGAATATTVSYAVLNVVMSWTLFKMAGVHPFHRDLVIVVVTSPIMLLVGTVVVSSVGRDFLTAVAAALIAWIGWLLLVAAMGAINYAELRAFLPKRSGARSRGGQSRDGSD